MPGFLFLASQVCRISRFCFIVLNAGRHSDDWIGKADSGLFLLGGLGSTGKCKRANRSCQFARQSWPLHPIKNLKEIIEVFTVFACSKEPKASK
jgi:hypothetical protein